MGKTKKAQKGPASSTDAVAPAEARVPASASAKDVSTDGAKSSGGSFLWSAARILLLLVFCYYAVDIRLNAVRIYGRIIHEFDPWFNYRATEYLVAHGYKEFVNWFDYESWYPLGRPVGTTIYPGMMITSSFIYHTLQSLGLDVSVNDVCVFVPAGFAVITTVFTYLLAYEVSRDGNAAVFSAGIMAIIPAHLMRSVAGGYDNESIAVAAIVGTFFFWTRSLRTKSSWPIGAVAGVSYVYMVAAWGAYTYVLNMIALHTFVLVAIGRYSANLHKAYSLFYIIGTYGALQFPIVGWQPFDSMEQVSGLIAFFLLQLLAGLEFAKNQFNMNDEQYRRFKLYVLGGLVAVGLVIMRVLFDQGVLLPVTARIRGLFVQHTKTGNPLVDSVAEHQSTRPEVYVQYFNFIIYLFPFGLLSAFFNRTAAKWFFILYCVTSAYFSNKMIRLVLLMAPSASIAGGITLSLAFAWTYRALSGDKDEEVEEDDDAKKKKRFTRSKTVAELAHDKFKEITGILDSYPTAKAAIAVILVIVLVNALYMFTVHSFVMSERLSEPQIILRGRGRDGQPILVDDFREAYFWLRDNTPENSRILSWWDYGYQINGVGNRTTLADGNTWNHEHIALLGRVLISPERHAHRIARHLADYVLIWTTRWAGMYGDDLAKCPHMARIAGSVFFDIPFKDYYMVSQTQPSPALEKSLLYQLHSYGLDPRVPEPKYFEEAYTTTNRMVRIFKVKNVSEASREYADTHHTYPPELQPILEKSNAFERSREGQFMH